MIEEERFPHRDISILAAGYRLRVPVTVHIGLGYDIIHEHPNCDGAALGEASYRDFLIITQTITQLQGGVLLNFGSAVMGPEVYLKALSMARNVAHQEGRRINEFTTAVFDLQDLGPDLHHEAPKTDARYYYRPFKTILVRTVQDGGESFYIRGPHQGTLPALYRLVCASSDAKRDTSITTHVSRGNNLWIPIVSNPSSITFHARPSASSAIFSSTSISSSSTRWARLRSRPGWKRIKSSRCDAAPARRAPSRRICARWTSTSSRSACSATTAKAMNSSARCKPRAWTSRPWSSGATASRRRTPNRCSASRMARRTN